MAVSLDLLINAIVAGILLGGFYAAVTVGITITFGMLDIANIAQPAFILLGSYAAYIINRSDRARSDPDRRLDAAGLLRDRHGRLSALLPCVRIARRAVDPGSRLLFRSAVCRRSVADPGLRRRLPLCRSALYRPEPAVRYFRPAAADADPVRGVAGHDRRAAALPDAQLYRPGDPGGIAGRARVAADGGEPDPDQADRFRHFDRDLRAWPALF